MVGSRPLECRPAQNIYAEHMRRTDFTWSLKYNVEHCDWMRDLAGEFTGWFLRWMGKRLYREKTPKVIRLSLYGSILVNKNAI
jgi:hypothetical protein